MIVPRSAREDYILSHGEGWALYRSSSISLKLKRLFERMLTDKNRFQVLAHETWMINSLLEKRYLLVYIDADSILFLPLNSEDVFEKVDLQEWNNMEIHNADSCVACGYTVSRFLLDTEHVMVKSEEGTARKTVKFCRECMEGLMLFIQNHDFSGEIVSQAVADNL